jgi:flavin-dependent dehydrogenase
VVEAMLRRECGGVDEALRTAVREHPWMASGPLDPGVRLRSDDVVFRIGNAAAEAHPIIGEGMSMAMQSAWLLCAQLLAPASDSSGAMRPQGSATEVALWQRHIARRYTSLWRRKFSLRLRLAAVLAQAAMRPRWSGALLHVAQLWPAGLSQGVKWCGKTRTVPDAETIARLGSGGGAHRAQAVHLPAHPEPASL